MVFRFICELSGFFDPWQPWEPEKKLYGKQHHNKRAKILMMRTRASSLRWSGWSLPFAHLSWPSRGLGNAEKGFLVKRFKRRLPLLSGAAQNWSQTNFWSCVAQLNYSKSASLLVFSNARVWLFFSIFSGFFPSFFTAKDHQSLTVAIWGLLILGFESSKSSDQIDCSSFANPQKLPPELLLG